VFDPDLDIVAIGDDARFASYTITMLDSVSGVGSLEPFGTHPDYRGTGLSKTVLNEALSLLKQKGMHSVRIYTAGFDHQAQRLYQSCGFKKVDTNRTLIRYL
jgi:ribosomal protein S18 acetylase RimI-like enzyme